MSSVVISGDTSGAITLAAPSVAGTNTITLPASTGTIAVADGSGNLSVTGNLQFNSGYGSVGTAYGCRAWVNFNGTGTVAIRASGNVSSITDNGTGAYAINFTTAMPDANYSANVSVSSVPSTSDANFIVTDANNTALASPTTTAFSMTVFRFQGSPIDTSFVRVSVFR